MVDSKKVGARLQKAYDEALSANIVGEKLKVLSRISLIMAICFQLQDNVHDSRTLYYAGAQEVIDECKKLINLGKGYSYILESNKHFFSAVERLISLLIE